MSTVMLVGLVSLIVGKRIHAEPPSAFRAADGLFDKANLKTLGLEQIGGQHIVKTQRRIHESRSSPYLSSPYLCEKCPPI